MDEIVYLAAILCGVVLVAVFVNKRLLTLILSSIFMLMVAIRLSIPTMYLMGAVLMALPLASYTIGLIAARRLSVDLKAPDSLFVGDTTPVRVDVRSPQAVFSTLAQTRCNLPDGLVRVEGSDSVTPIPGGIRQEFIAKAVHRGVFDLTPDAVAISDPLGIFTINRRLLHPKRLIVYPVGLPRDLQTAVGNGTTGWLLDASTGRRGDEEGFYGTREYRTGDDTRRIHWRTSARCGNLVIAERETSASASIWICLDLDRGVYQDSGETLEQVVRTAVTIMETALRNGHSVGLMVSQRQKIRIPPQASEGQRWRILEALAIVDSDGESLVDHILTDRDIGAGATVALLTPNPSPWIVDAVSHLIANGVQATVVYVQGEPTGSANRHLRAAAAAGAGTLIVPVEASRPVEIGTASF